MGCQSKASKARLCNLGIARNSRKATVEDCLSDEEDMGSFDEEEDILEHGFFIADDYEGPLEDSEYEYDSESDEEVSEDEVSTLKNEAAIHHFNQILFEAQAMAVKAEKDASGEQRRKRKHHYTGNSVRTKQYHAQKRRALAGTSQKFITSMFSKKRQDVGNTLEKLTPDKEVIEVEDNSESEEEQDDVKASLAWLFCGSEEDQVGEFTRLQL